MNTLARLLIIIVLVAVACSFASAEIVSYSGNVTFTDLNQNASIVIPRFDPGLGTLNSVTVTFWDSGQANLTLTANSGNITSAYGQITRGYDVTGIGFSNFTNSSSAFSPYYTNIIAGTTIGPQMISFNNATAESFTIPSGSFSLYTGSGDVSYAVAVGGFPPVYFTNTTGISGGNMQATFTDSNLRVGTTVTYNYTSDPGIPEPSSLALLPMALTGLMFWRRRRTA